MIVFWIGKRSNFIFRLPSVSEFNSMNNYLQIQYGKIQEHLQYLKACQPHNLEALKLSYIFDTILSHFRICGKDQIMNLILSRFSRRIANVGHL